MQVQMRFIYYVKNAISTCAFGRRKEQYNTYLTIEIHGHILMKDSNEIVDAISVAYLILTMI